MDTAIANGDFAVTAGGIPLILTGLDQLLQQVYLRLKMKRGSFCYDPTMGSRLHTLPEQKLMEQVLSCVEEALRDRPDYTVTSLELTETGISVSVTTDHGSGTVIIS